MARDQRIVLVPFDAGDRGRLDRDLFPFVLTGAWRIEGRHGELHSFSGLALAPDGRLVAATDRGRWAVFPPPGEPGRTAIRPMIMRFPWGAFRMGDAEALQIDRETGRRWVCFEHHNSIMRHDPLTGENDHVRPAAMRRWPGNRGCEALVRLPDGRFLVIAETLTGDPPTHPGLLFPGDPLEGADPVPFRVALPPGYRATDAAVLPDGHVLVLARGWRFPFGFSSVIAHADPATIARRRTWHVRPIARIATGPLADNYEGLAIDTAADGTLTVWLVADDNQARLLQKSLLLKLEVPARQLEKAMAPVRRRPSPAPS